MSNTIQFDEETEAILKKWEAEIDWNDQRWFAENINMPANDDIPARFRSV